MRIPDWTHFQEIPLYWVCIPNYDIPQGYFKLRDCLSFPCLVPWFNHLHLCMSVQFFGESVENKFIKNTVLPIREWNKSPTLNADPDDSWISSIYPDIFKYQCSFFYCGLLC